VHYLQQMSSSNDAPPAVPSFIAAAIEAAARARASAVSIPTVASAAPRRTTVRIASPISPSSLAATAAPANETVLFEMPTVLFISTEQY
jgi:hypothetical protein